MRSLSESLEAGRHLLRYRPGSGADPSRVAWAAAEAHDVHGKAYATSSAPSVPLTASTMYCLPLTA